MKECKQCGKSFEPSNSRQSYCSDSCRAKAFRERKENKPMAGIEENTADVQLHHYPTDDFDINDAQGSLFRTLRAQLKQHQQTNYKLDAEKNALREERHEHLRKIERLEDKLERKDELHKAEVEKIKDKFERELKDFEASNGMGAIAREMITPEVIREVAPPLIQAFGGLLNRGQQMGNLPQYSPLAKQIADLVNKGAPEEQQKLFNLISSVINEAQLQNIGDDGVIILIDSIINSITNGTFRNKQQATN